MAEAKFGVKEVMNVTFYSLVNYKPVLYVDTLKLSNLENTAEQSTARGGHGNPILLTWDYNREANFTVQDALISFDGLALMTGKDVTTTAKTIYKREVLTLDASKQAELSHVPEYDTSPDDRLFVYNEATGIAGDVVSTVLVTKTITVASLAEGDKVVAYYPYEEDNQIQAVTISSADFPGEYKIVGDTFVRNANTGEDEPFQLIVNRAKVQPGFTLTMEAEGDPSVFDMNLMVMRPLDTTTMIEMIKYIESS